MKTMEKTTTIKIDFSNKEEVKKAILEHGDIGHMVFGKNSEGEDMDISITSHGIKTRTYQNNRWVRVNWYGEDGRCEGESFEGRWK